MHKYVLLLVLFLPIAVKAMTGEQLLKYCTNVTSNKIDPTCYGYIHGSLDSISNLKLCPRRTYHGYLNETVTLYLKTHPSSWKKTAFQSVEKAVKKAYPCP